MKTGIIRFPGSNCDYDAYHFFEGSFFIWHKDTEYPEDMDLLVIPGGFAFGDRIYDNATGIYEISPGTKCIESPVVSIIQEAAKRNTPILGICNGFQILIKMGLLPGELLLNENKTFTCKNVPCIMNYTNVDNFKTDLDIANSYGKYYIDDSGLAILKQNNQIFLQYGENVEEINSLHNIAGICNKSGTIFGMMPHPERGNNGIKEMLQNILLNHKKNEESKIREKMNQLMESEHISYKSTKPFLKTLHTEEDWVIQGPGENAGIIDIGDGYCIAARIESHNHPTFIDPYEGAATGVGGILRDIFTMGARPFAIFDFLRFGEDKHSNNLLNLAMKGISYYGNCVGVANVGGDCYTHKSYEKNPIVNIACLGILKKENIVYGRCTSANQCLIYVGSKTGYEGVGGAAMASNVFHVGQDMQEIKSTIQKSDPYLEKLLLEACLEIAENKLAIGMQDMGAGGLLCATYEVIKRGREVTQCDFGCKIFLDKVPTKYDMDSCDILISESQERMLIVADKKHEQSIFNIFQKWDLEYCTIGEVTLDGKYSLYNKKHLYTELFSQKDNIEQYWEMGSILHNESEMKRKDNANERLQYDSTIGNRTECISDNYSILNVPEVNKKLIISWGENILTCHQQLMELNAKPLAVINCLNYGHPAYKLIELSDDIRALNQYCKLHHVPVIGGNVSLYNSTDNVSIRSTPIFVLIGILIEV